MTITKINESDYSDKGIRVKNNPLGLSVAEAQRAFDELSIDVIIPAYNRMADEVDSAVEALETADNTNTQQITTNTQNIKQNTGDISNLEVNLQQISQKVTQNTNDISGIEDDTAELFTELSNKVSSSDVLVKNNTAKYTPSGDYNPATKKYVDDTISISGGGDMLKTVYDPQNKSQDIFQYANDISVSKLKTHTDNINNPHSVTAAQVGALAESDFTKANILSKIGTMPIANGGTGATSSDGAVTSLGITKKIYNPNLLINGDFQVWQRGTEITQSANTNKYTADGWILGFVNDGKTHTVKKDTDGSMYIDPNGGYTKLRQVIEIPDSLRGKTVFLQVCAKSGKSDSSDAVLQIGNGTYTDGTWGSPTISAVTATSEYAVFTASFTIPTTGLPYVEIYVYSTNILNIKWVKLEVGSVGTAFSPKSYSEELALCQRYFYSFNPNGATAYLGLGVVNTTTSSATVVHLPVSLRTNTPTVTATGSWNMAIVAVSDKGISSTALYLCTGNTVSLTHTLSATATTGSIGYVKAMTGANLTLDCSFY